MLTSQLVEPSLRAMYSIWDAQWNTIGTYILLCLTPYHYINLLSRLPVCVCVCARARACLPRPEGMWKAGGTIPAVFTSSKTPLVHATRRIRYSTEAKDVVIHWKAENNGNNVLLVRSRRIISTPNSQNSVQYLHRICWDPNHNDVNVKKNISVSCRYPVPKPNTPTTFNNAEIQDIIKSSAIFLRLWEVLSYF